MTRISALALAALALTTGWSLGPAAPPAGAGTLWLKSCSYFGDSGTATDVGGPVWQAQAPGVFSLANRCPLGGSFQIIPTHPMSVGASAQWRTVTPPTIGIIGAVTPLNTVLVLPGMTFDGFATSYFWNGGIQTIADEKNCCGGMDYGLGITRNDLNGSRYFGFQVSCIARKGCSGLVSGGQVLDVKGIELIANDSTPPAITATGPGNLWYQASHWVRGTWPITFQASDDSGVCGMGVSIDGQAILGPTAPRNQSSWTQCPTPQTMNQSIDTAGYPNGPLSLQFTAADAASPANLSSPRQTLQVDNQAVSLGLSGPTDVVSTAGPQYVRATASAGLSGVDDIRCSVDGSPYGSYAGAAAQIPVQGVGPHTVSCYAQNNAIDPGGRPASSTLQTWHLSIRQPTISAISLGTRLLDGLRCRSVTAGGQTPVRWVTVRRRGRQIRVPRRGRTVRRREVRCSPRVVIREVRAGGRRRRRERIVLLPHTVQLTEERVPFGRAATVGGWVGLANGTALAGVPVDVITATDNGLNRWRIATLASTSANGLWRVKLPAGPSRLIAAVYPGSSTTEPAISGRVHLIVAAKVLLSIHPRRARWGQTIQISGRVLGGNIPAGKLLRLRIGTAGIHSTVGIPDISPSGQYRTSWTFAPGHGVVRYWFSVSTLPEADYPYAQSSSPRVYVRVEG